MAVRAATTIGMAGVGLAGVLAGAVIVAGGDAAAATPCSATASPTPTTSATATATPSASSSASASPTATATSTASPTATASPTDGGILPGFPVPPLGGAGQGTTTATPTTSGSATASASTTPTTTVALTPRRVVKGEAVRITGKGLPGCRVDVLGYTRPSSTYRTIRSGTIADNGTYGFTIYPPANTRVYAKSQGAKDSTTTSVNVRFNISMKATRIGTRLERFEGGVAPGRLNVPVTVWRVTSSGPVKVGRTATESNGTWSLVAQFAGTGTFSFYAIAETTADNDSNRSPIVRATIS